jgi:NADH-quinone oxidoreductase subunit J
VTALVYISAIASVILAVIAVSHRHAVHAAAALIGLLLALALQFFGLGAPFGALLQVLIYAGAIMVLFVFLVMILNLGAQAVRREREWMGGGIWALPLAMALALLAAGVYAISEVWGRYPPAAVVDSKEVGVSLYSSYVIAVELASLLLIAALVAAFHLAPPTKTRETREARRKTTGSGQEASDVSPR